MSKAVRWTIPFASLNGTRYRIDIYDEGFSGTPVELRGGEVPFTTTENESDDLFSPVRSQTGTIEVCTAIPAGGMLKLDDILPANNIARPVRLVNLSNSNAIEWQGFLSCEAYSQDYTAVPQILDLPVISVLEAMASVQVNTARNNGLVKLNNAIYNALNEITVQSGLSYFTHINYSKTDYRIFTKYINQMAFFELKEYTNESSINYVIDGLSTKEVLSRLCTLMGWIAREQGTELYLERIGETIGMRRDTLSGFYNSFNTGATDVPLAAMNMANLTWRGANHQRTVVQGAKSVGVEANVKKYELKFGLPDFPEENLIHGVNGNFDSYVTMNTAFSNMLTFHYYLAQIADTQAAYSAEGDAEDAYESSALNPSTDISAKYPVYTQGQSYYLQRTIGAFFGKVLYDDEYVDGLFVAAVNELDLGTRAPIVFKMQSILEYTITSGHLVLTFDALTIKAGDAAFSQFVGSPSIVMKFGNQYWNGSIWTSSPAVWTPNLAQWADFPSFRIPVSFTMQGEISIEVYGSVAGGTNASGQRFMPYYDMFFRDLSVVHDPGEPENTYADRDRNQYVQLLGTNFRDEVSITTELATSLNNHPSPALVMETSYTPVTGLDYTVSGGTENRRPEKDLLSRMASYYGAARQQLKLEVLHPTQAALPVIKLNGIGDGKKYLPLAESRDWAADKSTLTCFETVNA